MLLPVSCSDPKTFLLLDILLAEFTGEHPGSWALWTGLGVAGCARCPCGFRWVAEVPVRTGRAGGKAVGHGSRLTEGRPPALPAELAIPGVAGRGEWPHLHTGRSGAGAGRTGRPGHLGKDVGKRTARPRGCDGRGRRGVGPGGGGEHLSPPCVVQRRGGPGTFQRCRSRDV